MNAEPAIFQIDVIRFKRVLFGQLISSSSFCLAYEWATYLNKGRLNSRNYIMLYDLSETTMILTQ